MRYNIAISAVKSAELHTSAPLSANKDYYKTLGVEKKADAKSIKKAYFNVSGAFTTIIFVLF